MALYRKYRPSSFSEVVGQEHVTEPLSIALDNGRINHAYLFSGPRGCGKTSSARILARSLNCVQGPTSTPCGVCDSCVALAPGGAGHIDVVEMDAATHNGVDDMRELRESAYFAPAESRYRVIILDEAHMITHQAFNALLKIVEEPPEHLIFIFATTEPEKLLTTIRSRTHNYPFRLLTPPDMRSLLSRVMEDEGVPVEDAVYPLVVRAGGGSPRDSLSIMDQLLAGSGPEGVTYQRALGLLGVTDASLIDRAVEAVAQQDQSGLFTVVDDVIEAGYDPRRFTEDLLDRFRDLMIIQSVPDAYARGLVNVPKETQDGLTAQADALGQATLTRCASLVNESLAQMKGATAPRLLLEILCARIALPGAGMTVEALAQRVEALESGAGVAPGGGASARAAGAAAGAGGREGSRRFERPSRRRAQSEASGSAVGSTESTGPQETPQATPQNTSQDANEDPKISEARRAREIMDRNRRSRRPEPQGSSVPAPQAQESEGPQQSPAQPTSEQQAAKPESTQDYAALWQSTLAALKEDSLDVWIAARSATARDEQGTAGELHVDHSTLALARYISTEAAQQAFQRALQAQSGSAQGDPAQNNSDLRVVAFVGGTRVEPAKGGEPSGKAEPAPEQAQQQAPAAQQASAQTQSETPAPEQTSEQAPDPAPSSRPLSALERARAMAESHAKRPSEQARDRLKNRQQNATSSAPGEETQADQQPQSGWRARMKKAQEKVEYNRANGFGDVPLPDEPPADPDYDDAAFNAAPPEYGASASGENSISEAEQAREQEEQHYVEELDKGTGQADHRRPLEVASEMVETYLGGTRVT
ncbi:DNA polymerase III subunit gamma and tau [Corynebacterium sp. 320]|uniref:DNA polymerase III subunit gamma and tau n=1 Tax=Corynebacterium TaxID=1716 RepID=UPI00125CBCFE|nr:MULTISPECIES: DNA polymerase III subunit gamma and tau [Corynebacterium]KAB1502850.1 DNA polymerase III subunit gamma and tau [Corynebacterium sp. 320]KAB1552361.1 DNA polymerase III subunit gamma and tau [Corynebacterium sp. 321]KAB1554424.1 DNA polymerase III subunit gamma and tau [Corynebacterium sp. 319]KAB3526513.1 DNA polymerase III subunit gamma and tau [Corynebacterium sp. 250]KAB3539833.1 DNA polymerase III subunit gamma and tau [Corynebacterium sp. 366]